MNPLSTLSQDPLTPAKKRSRKTKDEAIEILREQVKELEETKRSLTRQIRIADSKLAEKVRHARAAEEDAEACLEALAILARVVPSSKQSDRKAREAARKLLEDRGVHPPASLGTSRVRAKKKRRRKADPSPEAETT